MSNAIPADAWYQSGDLISLHYDSCPDADDIHASVSGKMVLDHFGLERDRDYVVVNGTCGDERPRTDYIRNSERIFDQLYGAQGSSSTWLNAFTQEAQSVSAVAARYRTTLEAGRKVWVAEGGPMDFTAAVIRQLVRSGFSGTLSDIKVIQHSHGNGFNERYTGDANLTYLWNRAEYITIDNGNLGNNRTAQLNQNSNGNPVYPPVDANLVNRFRNSSTYGLDWDLAFRLFNPSIRFDGSDTVELLWIFGLQSEDIADWYGFANVFLPAGSGSSAGGSASGGNAPTQNGTTIRFEAESANLGSGWVIDTNRAGFTGRGYIRWNGGNAFAPSTAGRGTTRYTFSVPTSGAYQLRIRARAIDPPRGDLNNDAWFRMNGQNIRGTKGFRNWVKIYTSGGDRWRTAGTADFDRDEKFRQHLVSGRDYVLELSGRSQNYAIDYIELFRTGN